MLGGSWPGNEYGWGSIRVILSRRPQRVLHVLASLVVLLIGVAIALLVALIVGSLAGAITSVLTGHPTVTSGVLTDAFAVTVAKTFLVTWYGASFILVLSFASGTVFRSAPAGIGIGVGATLAQFLAFGILEGQSGFWKTVADHLPLQYVENLTQNVAAPGFLPHTALGTVGAGTPGTMESILALGIMMLALLVATCLVVHKRDITA